MSAVPRGEHLPAQEFASNNTAPALILSRSRRTRVTLALLAISLGGCAIDQKKEVALYRDVLNSRIAPAEPYAPASTLTLPHAMALAIAGDESLGTRGEDYVQALIARHRALAAFLPTVSFQPSFVVAQPSSGSSASSAGQGQQVALGPVSTGINQTGAGTLQGATGISASGASGTGLFRKTGGVATRFEAPVVGSINVFRGGGDVASLKVADWDIEWRKQLMLDAQDTILLNTAQAYYQVLRSERQAAVLRNSLKLQEERVRLVKEQFAQKLATKLAVAQSEAQADATRVTLVSAEGDVRNGRSTLAYVIGVPEIDGPLADDLGAPTARPALQAFGTIALNRRRDLAAAVANSLAARHAVDVYFSQYYPSVSLNISGFLYREYFSDATKWDAILTANVPIFSAGLIRADVRDAWSRLRQAALAESGTRRQILHDVEIAYSNLATADQEIIELEGEVAAADEALRQSRSAFENGLAINLDVLQAQDQLLTAQLQLTSARYDRIVFYLDLIRATGELTPQTLIHTTATTVPSTVPVK